MSSLERSDGATADGADGPGGRRPRRWSLRNWRVRSRLVALIAVPTIVAVALGAVGVGIALSGAAAYDRVGRLAGVAAAVTTSVGDLENEQALSAAFVGAGRSADRGRAVADAQRRTDAGTARLREAAAGIGDGYPASTRDRLRRALFRLDTLPALRSSVTAGRFPAGVTVDRYDTVVADLLALDDEIAQEGTDPELSASVRALGALSRSRAALSTQRALLGAAFLAGRFEPGGDGTLAQAAATQQSALEQFRASGSVARRYDEVVAGPDVDQTSGVRDGILAGRPPAGGAAVAGAWEASAAGTLAKVGTVESELVTTIADRAAQLRSEALRQALIVGILALAVVLIVLVATTAVARSLVRPLRALRDGALAVAERRLPDTVARLGREDPDAVDTRVEPIAVHSADEIGEVARSFDAVHAEAVRAAVAEARRRAQAAVLFVTLSRRTQSLVDRQIELIDELERGEQDGDRLDSLFRLDHLATRMRRNGENLLVLGGQDPVRRWNRPLRLLDVLRAALSEVEQYQRIDLDQVPALTVGHGAVSDVVHLLAELLENATAFSSRTSRVEVATTALPDGSALVEITDHGIGLTARECDELGRRLAAPTEVDVDASRRMGLYVVGRLAARLGARVWLRPGERRGVTASVALPAAVLSRGEAPVEPVDAGRDGADGSWIGERFSRAVATPGPGPDSWFGGASLGTAETAEPAGGPLAPAAGAAAFTPRASGTTTSGLPQREPGANEVPGTGPDRRPPEQAAPGLTERRAYTARHAAPESPGVPSGVGPGARPAGARTAPGAGGPADATDRSPDAVRRRYASYQRGRRGVRPDPEHPPVTPPPPAADRPAGAARPPDAAPPPDAPDATGTAQSSDHSSAGTEGADTSHPVAGAVGGAAVLGGAAIAGRAATDDETPSADEDARADVPDGRVEPAEGAPAQRGPDSGGTAPTGREGHGDPAGNGRQPWNGAVSEGVAADSTAAAPPGPRSAVGWAAEPVREPSAAGSTSAGLPLRGPGDNYVPGSLPSADGRGDPGERDRRPGPAARPSWDRSAEAIRQRYAAHQQGRRRGTERTGR